jgi:acyl carrier protein
MCRKAKWMLGDSAWIVNQYGPTESTLTCSYHRVCETDSDGGFAPLGEPIPNARICILDEYLNLVPVGIPGELHIGGIGITRGYVNRPDLTAEKFIPDPLSGEPGKRIYKTGDLARYRTDGTIEFLGRIDHQVKIRGCRVELGEIENVLAHHPGVEQVLAMAPEEGDELVAYVIPKKNQAPTAEEFRRFLKHDLPEYMVPSDFVMLDAFPLTTNRKVDRGALPRPARTTMKDKVFIAPRNPSEQRIADIWAEILKQERLGILENFFDIGGHSLLATRVVSRIRRVFEINFPLRKLFENPTIEGLALQVGEMQRQKVSPERMVEVLGKLEILSDEEALLLLAQEQSVSRRSGL